MPEKRIPKKSVTLDKVLSHIRDNMKENDVIKPTPLAKLANMNPQTLVSDLNFAESFGEIAEIIRDEDDTIKEIKRKDDFSRDLPEDISEIKKSLKSIDSKISKMGDKK